MEEINKSKDDTDVKKVELKNDSIDSRGENKKSEAKIKKDKYKDTKKVKKVVKDGGIKKKLLEELDEDAIRELLLAKKELEAKTQILEEKSKLLYEYEDLLKRKQAEFENYRKRVQKEIEENRKYATVEMVLDILNIIDNFERAIESAKSSRDFDSFLDGIIIIKNEIQNVLEKKYNVERIDAIGKEFDPMIHDAIMMEESDQYTKDTVVEDFQRGYIMHNRTIRPSKVKVAKAVVLEDYNNNEEAETCEKGE